MSVRVRVVYERRGGACFVPHIALISMFTRAAVRAGLVPEMTKGFTPHTKMSFGPELPAGVVALGEPLDIWISNITDIDNGFAGRWSDALPEGFRITSASVIEEGAPSLGKQCKAALYWIRSVGALSCDDMCASARAFYGDDVIECMANIAAEDGKAADWMALTLAEPAKNGIGGWVKSMIADGLISGWHELNIVRAAIGDSGLMSGMRNAELKDKNKNSR